MRKIISCDPGAKGFLCAWDVENNIREYLPIEGSTRLEIADFLRKYSEGSIAVMELIHAVFGASAKSTFNFGEVFGFLQGLFVALRIPYHLVQPKDWQSCVWISTDKVYKEGKKVDTKKTSMNAALRLFPNIDFRKTERCKNLDDNKVDATLIGEYARRKNL